MTPLFSVIIPTYNRAGFIAQTIRSVLAQDCKDFELIVIDDGSKDATEEVVRGFMSAGVKYHKKENGERGAARNAGTKRAMGKYVNFLDSDDLLYPNHLAVASKLIEEYKDPEFFHLAYDFKSPEGKVTEVVNNFDRTVRDKVMFGNILSCNGIFLKRDLALQYPFEEDRALASSEDWELWIRLLSRVPIQFSNEITSSVINHDLRSLKTVSVDQVVKRDLLMIELLKKDREVMNMYGRSFNRFIAERYTFFMLCLAEQGKRAGVWSWAWKALGAYPMIAWSRRFLASLKKTL